ncbi:MAG: hypothetical protein JRI25_03180 [Deltaproteobacteria bacterium]|nr:hypothetical protein [Deltaproteobacteria bacterium]MBW2253587.1 hypothetical protein [Deltaproteobacteria bacterium]
MLLGLYIFVDDDFDDPIYAAPDSDELDEEAWEAGCEAIVAALEGDGHNAGVKTVGELRIGWKSMPRAGISFLVIVPKKTKATSVVSYLRHLSRTYMEEVDDPRYPGRHGVEEVVIEVIPPWEA